jgi:hypothetical protein
VSTNPLTRRRLLQLGGVAGGALAVGSALLMRGGGDEHYRALAPQAVPKILSLKELGVLAAFCERICPPPDATHPGAKALRVAERIDRELSFHPKKMQSDVQAALLVVEHGGVLHGSATRFTRLREAEQDLALERMAVHGNEVERQVMSSLKLLALFFYYCDDRTWKAIHYDGPFQPRKAPEADSRLEARS